MMSTCRSGEEHCKQPRLICLEHCLMGCESLTEGSGREFRFGTSLEDLLGTVGSFGVEHWRQDLEEVGPLHPASIQALSSMVPWDKSQEIEQLRIYVDGSHFCEHQTAWAAAAIGRVGGNWQWVGFPSGRVFPAGSDGSVGLGECNAHTAELHAMVRALCAASALDCIDVELVYDAIAAADIVQGLAQSSRHQQLARIATSLNMVAVGRRVKLGYRHVRSHQGDALNELADSIARATALGEVNVFEFKGHLARIERKGAFEWWWLTVNAWNPAASGSYKEVGYLYSRVPLQRFNNIQKTSKTYENIHTTLETCKPKILSQWHPRKQQPRDNALESPNLWPQKIELKHPDPQHMRPFFCTAQHRHSNSLSTS